VAAGETKPVTVTASGAWTAASDQSWLTLSTGNGTGNTTISVTAANYTGTAPRTAKVTFTSSSITQEVNVTQQGASAPPTLAVSPATLSFVAAGETKPVTVTASGAWTAASDQSW
ncbi:BACON domain-containing protein, partial [Tannerella forsythia]